MPDESLDQKSKGISQKEAGILKVGDIKEVVAGIFNDLIRSRSAKPVLISKYDATVATKFLKERKGYLERVRIRRKKKVVIITWR